MPYIGVPLSDLTFAEDGNPDFYNSSEDYINFSKREIICKIIMGVNCDSINFNC